MNAKERALELARDGALTDEVIVSRVVAGEVPLFEVLIRRHNQRVYRCIRSIVTGEDEAEEVMQQAYVAAYTHLGSFQGTARFSTWLVKIAINEALGRKRKASRLVAIDGGKSHEEPMSEQPNPEERAATRELASLVEQAVDALPELYRTVFMLREIEGLGTADVAEVLDVSEDVVKTRLHRAKAMVRQKLEATLGEAAGEAFSFHARRCDRVVAAVFQRIRA